MSATSIPERTSDAKRSPSSVAAQSRTAGLATRLLAGQSLVLVAGGLTVGAVATVIGPPIFHAHLVQAGQQDHSPELTHIEMAYRDASLISLGIGLVISLLAAGAVTWFLTRRLRRPLNDLTDAARELSRGHYAARVPDVGSGTELDTLAGAFNAMAARLEEVEDTRRRLLSDLAHELRTPIATLTAYHDGLHDHVVGLGEDSRAVLAEQTGRLARLADDITEVSRAEEGRLSLEIAAQPVPDIVRAAVEGQREDYAAKGVGLVSTVDGAPVQAMVDRGRITQVLTNLLTNALRHSPAGSTVRVAVRAEDREVAVVVTDTGDGIAAEQLPHVFERFFRGDAARDRDRAGSGIGLTISKALVDAHGGAITAESDGTGTGARFTVFLPRAPRPTDGA